MSDICVISTIASAYVVALLSGLWLVEIHHANEIKKLATKDLVL